MMTDPAHPGEILREDVVNELGLTVSDAAARIGISRVSLSRIVHCRVAISPDTAIRLELAGVGTARAWLAMQSAYDLARAREVQRSGVQLLAGPPGLSIAPKEQTE